MKTHQDTRRISSEEWSQLHQSTRRQAHEFRREMFEGILRGSVAAFQSALVSACRSIQRLVGATHPAAKSLNALPPV